MVVKAKVVVATEAVTTTVVVDTVATVTVMTVTVAIVTSNASLRKTAVTLKIVAINAHTAPQAKRKTALLSVTRVINKNENVL